MKQYLRINLISFFSVFVYITTFFRSSLFNYNIVRYILLVVVGIFLISRLTLHVLKKNTALNIAVFLFSLISLCVSFGAQGDFERNPFYANLVFIVAFVEFALFLQIAEDKNMIDSCLRIWYRCAWIVVILTDILVFAMGEVDGQYLTGTKFAVVYEHFFLIALFMIRHASAMKGGNKDIKRETWIRVILLLTITFIVSIYVKCTTGMLGTAILFIMYFLICKFKNMLTNPIFFVISILISFGVMWVVDFILLSSGVQNLLVTYLKEDITLTGRTFIFAGMPKAMNEHWLLGYGYGTTFEVCMKFVGAADTQNALMEWIMQVGIVGTVSLLSIWTICIKRVHQAVRQIARNFNHWAWLLALVYTYIVLGTIEITYNMQFMCIMIMMYSMSVNTQKSRNEWLVNKIGDIDE